MLTIRIPATASVALAAMIGLLWNSDDGSDRQTVEPLAVNEPVGDELFAVGSTLTEDGRIGKVSDVQGTVSIKPVLHRRWTPVTGPVILKPGDWLRTDARGANAVSLRLAGQTELTLGPGTLVELPTPTHIKLGSGELKIAANKKTPIQLTGPDGKSISVSDTVLCRVDAQTDDLVRIETAPIWLEGFEGTTAHDSIGSLVANIDGRNVPLTVGYHKVTVDIRDQIARTVIEESFVNHTNSRTEGVFYFPLPQDASISGFGMWIGSELVEADVVEKQRAREIYETILRERRDPGLLEWTGGNLFKARVFPIEAHSEKRIKITYTQVLPLAGDRYRYSYGLQSEMLRQHPLRELAIDVKISSVLPLADVCSPTHMARIDKTEHSAHIEFAAQEYTPDRDFEVVVGLDGGQQNVAVIPHRRGDDGYFMLLLTPPIADGQWKREALPDGDPLELLILADTSGSMDDTSRQNQAAFIAALLGSMTEQDRINLAVCDVDCQWVFDEPQPASEKRVAAAREFLADRISLGWTDLDKAFASTLDQCGPETQVIYIGDGVVTTGDADPTAFVKRLRRLSQDRPGTFHAVSVSSSLEPVVLKTVASLGGGSVRQIGGEQTPQKVAVQLLTEMTQPIVRDLQVDFRDLTVARVYPEQLPNLSAGTQQILLGRYLPEDADQTGEVVVTGTYDGRPVRFSTEISLKDAESGNAFIPRLWARMHLDALLEQGSSPAIKDEMIALSEEYHIITPYTSLLVLESDEDRERFKVERRFLMRGGEQFFAEGRDRAEFELLQKQMQLAGNWRLGLRRQVLQAFMGLGRDVDVFQAASPVPQYGGFDANGVVAFSAAPVGMSVGGAYYPGSVGRPIRFGMGLKEVSKSKQDGRESNFGDGDYDGVEIYDDELPDVDALPTFDWTNSESVVTVDERNFDLDMLDDLQHFVPMDGEDRTGEPVLMFQSNRRSTRGELATKMPASKPSRAFGTEYFLNKRLSGSERAKPQRAASWYQQPGEVSFIFDLFSGLAEPPVEPSLLKTEPWPEAARRLAESLLRKQQLAALAGGLQIERVRTSVDPRWNVTTGRYEWLALVSPKTWLTRSSGGWEQTLVNWCDDGRRGVYSVDLQLGRSRESTPRDETEPPLALQTFVSQSLERSYANYTVDLQLQGDGRTQLVLRHPSNSGYEVHILVDTAKKVVLRIENRQDGEVTSTTRFGAFVQVAGAWWATLEETLDNRGRTTLKATLKFTELDRDAFARRVRKQLADRDRVPFWQQPVVPVKAAKAAAADGSDTFDDQMTLLVHFARIQDWSRVMEHLVRAEQLAGDKPGMGWVRNAVLRASRRHDDLRQRVLDAATQLSNRNAPSAFLADWLLGRAAGILEANEMLGLLDVLKPAYDRQAVHLDATKRWLTQRVNFLQQSGQVDQVLELRRELAEEYPHDESLQIQYVNALSQMSEYEAAYVWLDRVVVPESRWMPGEEAYLRTTYYDLLESEGRYPDMVDYLDDWLSQEPENQNAYALYLSALVRSDREEDANPLIARWIREARRPGATKSAAAIGRLNAAVSQALGQGRSLYTNRIEQRWFKPLAETVEFFATHESQSHIADRIMNQWTFTNSDACRRVRTKMAAMLLDQLEAVPAQRLQPLVGWIMPSDPEIDTQEWRRMAQAIRKRWAAEQDTAKRDMLAGALVQILSSRLTAEEHLAFLRTQLADGLPSHRASYATQLFDALLSKGMAGGKWTAEHEDEAFGLLMQLSDAGRPVEQWYVQIAALHRLVDATVQGRYDARMAEVEHTEDQTRTELRATQLENLRLAREGTAKRLRAAEREHTDELVRWLQIERLYLSVLLKRDLDKVAEACWKALDFHRQTGANEVKDGVGAQLNAILYERYLTTLANLAVRPTARPGDVDRLLNFVDAEIAAADQVGDEVADPVFGWKVFKYQLLVALDRPKQLEQALQTWTGPADADNFWRRSLAYIAAEQGRMREAIDLFEKVETDDELIAEDYRALAGWYLVSGDRYEQERALIESFKTMEEWRMSDWLYQQLRPWQRSDGSIPEELDKDVLRMFAALFQKSGNPENYEWQLRQFYRATRDFRLLSGLADAVIGHTPGRVYPFLQRMSSTLEEVRDEATADSIVQHLAEVRKRAKSDVDFRALDLLELLIERRSSEVLNQPGPHVDKALAAMQRAFRREWTTGEPRLMADLLASLGRITQHPVADEQVRQLETLHGQSESGSLDRLHIAHALARTYWNYARHDEAIDLLESALAEYQRACEGILSAHANGPLDTFVGYLESRGHDARGEQVLFDHLKHPSNRQQTFWLKQRLYRLYNNTLDGGGDVSLGSGQLLYQAVTKQIWTDLETEDHNHRYQLVDQLCTIYRTAKRKTMDGVIDDVREFAFKRLPDVLGMQTNNYQSIVSQVANTLEDLAGPRDGLELLIERIEHEPSWFRLNGNDGWSQHSYRLADWRRLVGDKLGEIEPRLLAITVAELKRDLQSRQSRNRNLYHKQNGSYYWSEYADDFAQTAEEVYRQERQSGAAVQYIADYLFWGLERHSRSIEMLLDAYQAELLEQSGQRMLVDFLHRRERYAESIPILLPLVERYPGDIPFSVWLMHAYFQGGRTNALLALLKKTDDYFHQEGRWREAAMAALAKSCLDNQLFEQSVAYYEEVINLHQRTQPGRGIGGSTLSMYYSYLSQAYSGWKKTPEAVDAACGAVISWGPRHDQRAIALNALENVVRSAPNLDGYVEHLDRQLAETGLDNAIVRKAVGKVYFEKAEYAKAIRQLELACELQPNDTETHQQLVACYDEMGDRQGATRRLLESVKLSRRNIQLYKDLGQRYEKAEKTELAERAFTSIVEALPNESEGHTMLAETRQQQDRWPAAIGHWERVAKIRELEPTGLVKLAEAQFHQRAWDEADRTIKRLRARTWPERFGNLDSQIQNLQRRLDQERGKD